MAEILKGVLLAAGLIVGALAAAHLLGLRITPRASGEGDLEALIEKHGPAAIAEARTKCAELPPGAERTAWGYARFGREWIRIEEALHLTDGKT